MRQLVSSSTQYKSQTKIIQNGNCSDSKVFVKENYPEVEYIESENNYLFSYNSVIKESKSKTVFVLNDDLKLSDNILTECLPLFSNPKLFAVSCLFYDWGTKNIQLSGSTISLSKGWMNINHNNNLPQNIEYCFYTSGGASIYRTEMFNALNGFDKVYSPAYYEDGDLSHRAWHRGWCSIIHPKATVEHRAGESWSNTKKEKDLLSLQLRNKLIGMIVNTHSNSFLINFVLRLPYRIIYAMLFQPIVFSAYISLLRKTKKIVKHKIKNKKNKVVGDRFMLEKLGEIYVE